MVPWVGWDLAGSSDPSKYLGLAKLGLATAGTLLLAWGFVLRRLGRPRSQARARALLLGALGAASAACWFNFFQFHQGGVFLHTGEIFHHYVGAKYFPELGYERLYDCTVVADYAEGFRYPPARRPVRRLATNRIETATAVLADRAACTDHFSPERWRAFRRDVAHFRSQYPPRAWVSLTTDRGYNATPAWTAIPALLANTGPATDTQVLALALVDPLLLLAMWGCVAWAFGWRTLCVALIYWGTSYASIFGWTGGALLRQDWLATAVIGICLLRRDKPGAAGFALTVATLLRMTPAILVAGVVFKALESAWRRRTWKLSGAHRRFAIGCVAALGLALPLSVWSGGGDAWPGFVRNTLTDFGTPSGNFLGWKTVVAYDHATRMQAVADRRLVEPHAPWQQARRETFERRQPWFWLGILGFLGLLLPAWLRADDWEAAVLGAGLMVVWTQVPSYYYALLLVYAFLWQRRESIGVGLCGLAAASWAIAGGFASRDETFTWVSLASVGFVVFATFLAARRPGVSSAVDPPTRDPTGDAPCTIS